MKTKAVKRAEAEARQDDYDKRPGFDKLAVIAARPGSSRRERARVLGGIAPEAVAA